MFQARAAAEDVVGNIEHVIGFMIGLVNLEELQPLVNLCDEPALPCEHVYGPDTARGQSLGFLGQVILDVAGREHRVRLILPLDFSEPTLVFPLATPEFLSYSLVHSKCLLA